MNRTKKVHDDDKVTTTDGKTYRVIAAPTADEQRDYPDIRVWCVEIDDPDTAVWIPLNQIAKSEQANWLP